VKSSGIRGCSVDVSAVPSVLQCVAVCCSVVQCVAVCCSVVQCVAESMLVLFLYMYLCDFFICVCLYVCEFT